jgi:hypothetical protein
MMIGQAGEAVPISQGPRRGMVTAMRDAGIRQLPLQRRCLLAMGGEVVAWKHDGRFVRGRATGELFGADADWLLVGEARFIVEDGSEVFEYPTRVLAEGRFAASARPVPSGIDLMLESADLDPDERDALRHVLNSESTSQPTPSVETTKRLCADLGRRRDRSRVRVPVDRPALEGADR